MKTDNGRHLREEIENSWICSSLKDHGSCIWQTDGFLTFFLAIRLFPTAHHLATASFLFLPSGGWLVSSLPRLQGAKGWTSHSMSGLSHTTLSSSVSFLRRE